MPYRRTRRSYSRRKKPDYLWVRSHLNLGSISSNGLGVADLLAPLHYDVPVMKVPGPGTGSPATDLHRAMLVRLHLKVTAHLTGTDIDDQTGTFFGVQVGRYQQSAATLVIPSVATSEPYNPADPTNAANTTDWLAWGMISAFEDGVQAVTAGAAYTDSIVTKNVDVKSRRVLRELGDTLVFSAKPNVDAATVAVVSSALWRRA